MSIKRRIGFGRYLVIAAKKRIFGWILAAIAVAVVIFFVPCWLYLWTVGAGVSVMVALGLRRLVKPEMAKLFGVKKQT